MKCAIYARKSNDDAFKGKENKSVTRQVEEGKIYINKKGWKIMEDHIYIDDGISGAEYQNRPSFHRLLNNLNNFDCLVMWEHERFGRDMTRNAFYLSDILESNVRIFYYQTDEEEKADNPEQKLFLNIKSYGAEHERLKASKRSRDALVRKAKKGFNTGGIVFGYDNVPLYSNQVDEKGKPIKSHTDYKINDEQAKIIEGIFKMYADGFGCTKIAKTLNGEECYEDANRVYFNCKRVAPPRKGSGSWAPAGIRAMLSRKRYIGIIPYGEYRKDFKKGTKVRIKQKEFLKVDRPDLKIIGENLWGSVQKRLKAVRGVYIKSNDGNLHGHPRTGLISKYLLSGIGQCDVCGASISVQCGSYGSKVKRWKVPLYHCSHHYKRGNNVCSNKLMQKVETIDNQFLTVIEKNILTPENVSSLYRKTIEEIKEQLKERVQNKGNPVKELQKERDKIGQELRNFENLIAEGEANTTVLGWIEKRNQRLKELEQEIHEIEMLPKIYELDLVRIEKELPQLVMSKIDNLRGLLKRNTPSARQALEKLIKGRVKFIPDSYGEKLSYRLKTTLKTDAILDTNNFSNISVPKGTRTPVTAVKGRCPGPLDDGDVVIADCRVQIEECKIQNPKLII